MGITLPLRPRQDVGGQITLTAPLLVHPDTGRLLPPVRLGNGRSGAIKAALKVEFIPVPIRCAHHGRWHALPEVAVPTSDLPVFLSPHQEHPAAALGTVLALASAPSCQEAERRASAFRVAWQELAARLLPSDDARDEADAVLRAYADSLTLLPRALAHSGIDLRDALEALASARLPRASHPVWPPPSEWRPSGSDAYTSRSILPHRCPVSQDWHAAGSVWMPRLDYDRFFSLFQATHGMCAALAAQASTTCHEASARLDAALGHLHKIWPEDETSRGHILACRQAARALRTALLPPPDLALEALRDA
jgi:hypothetical protein